MKKLKYIFYFIVIVWIGAFTQLAVNKFYTNEKRMMEAFADIQSDVIESKLQFTADYGTDYLDETDKKNLIQYFAKEIGLNSDYKISLSKGKDSEVISGTKQSKSASTVIEVVSTNVNNTINHYILITLKIFEKTDSILEYKNIVEKAAKSLEVKEYQSLITLNGKYNGKLSIEEKSNVVDKLVKRLQGVIINEKRTEDLFTVYAYTGLIEDYITITGEKVNVNIVVNYDEREDNTNIYLATPILNEDY